MFGAAYPTIYPKISKLANLGGTTLPAVFNISLWLTILLFVLITVTLFYFLDKSRSLRKDKVNG